MNFCWVTLPVKNFNASFAFYNGILGLPVSSKHSGNGMEMAMLGEADQPKIEIISTPGSAYASYSSDITVGIAVSSLGDAIKLLDANNIKVVRGPISPVPNTTFIFIKDPDGYEVQLVETKN